MAEPSTAGYDPAWLEYEKGLGGRPCLGVSPENIVQQFNDLGAAIVAQSPPPDPSVSTVDKDADGVPVRIYTPDTGGSSGALPVGVYYHGGGYLVGSLDSEDAWCRSIAKDTPCILVSVDYRLSTKHKWPAMIDDSYAAFVWAKANASKFNGDSNRVFTVGASAGGGLALSVALECIRNNRKSDISGVVAMVPVTAHPSNIKKEYKDKYTAYTENAADVPVIDAESMRIFFEAAGGSFNDERLFVTLSDKLGEMPPTYIATCGKDPLRDDGQVLEAMLKKEGVPTKSDYYDGVPHYFWLFPGIKGGREFLQNVAHGANWVLSKK